MLKKKSQHHFVFLFSKKTHKNERTEKKSDVPGAWCPLQNNRGVVDQRH